MNPAAVQPKIFYFSWPVEEPGLLEHALCSYGTPLLDYLLELVDFDINNKSATSHGTILAFVIDEIPERKDMIDILIRAGGVYDRIRPESQPSPDFREQLLQSQLNQVRLEFLKEMIISLGLAFQSADIPTLVLLSILDSMEPLALMFPMKIKWDLLAKIKHWPSSIKPPSPS